MRAPYVLIGNIAGVDVRLHAGAIFVVVAIGLLTSRPALALAAFAIIVAHEVGHAVLARRARYEVVAIDLAVLRGECRYRGSVTPRAESIIAWGGVVAQIVLALVALAIRWADKDVPETAFGDVAIMWLWPNLAIAAFNLIPAPRLDGAKAWRILRPPDVPKMMSKMRAHQIERELEDRRPKNKYDIN